MLALKRSAPVAKTRTQWGLVVVQFTSWFGNGGQLCLENIFSSWYSPPERKIQAKEKKERKTNYNWNRRCTGQTAKLLFTACPRSYTDITVNDLWPFRYEIPLCYFILLGSCVEFCCNLVIYWRSWGHTPNCLTTNPPEIHTSAFLCRLKKVSKMLSVPTALFFSVWSGSRRSTNCHILCNLIQFY